MTKVDKFELPEQVRDPYGDNIVIAREGRQGNNLFFTTHFNIPIANFEGFTAKNTGSYNYTINIYSKVIKPIKKHINVNYIEDQVPESKKKKGCLRRGFNKRTIFKRPIKEGDRIPFC